MFEIGTGASIANAVLNWLRFCLPFLKKNDANTITQTDQADIKLYKTNPDNSKEKFKATIIENFFKLPIDQNTDNIDASTIKLFEILAQNIPKQAEDSYLFLHENGSPKELLENFAKALRAERLFEITLENKTGKRLNHIAIIFKDSPYLIQFVHGETKSYVSLKNNRYIIDFLYQNEKATLYVWASAWMQINSIEIAAEDYIADIILQKRTYQYD